MKNILKTLAIALVLVLSSCSKDKLPVITPTITPQTTTTTTTTTNTQTNPPKTKSCGKVVSSKYHNGIQISINVRNDASGNIKTFSYNGVSGGTSGHTPALSVGRPYCSTTPW